MFHGITSDMLYCVARLTSVFRDDLGQEKQIFGTSFFLKIGDKTAIVTNAHLIDLNYGRIDSKYSRHQWHASYFDHLGKDASGLPTRSRKFILPATHNSILRHKNASNDAALIYNPQMGNLDGSTDRDFEYCIDFSDVATASELAEELSPFDVVAYPGFPPWHSQDGPRAILRGGTISSDPRYPYITPGTSDQDVILYEAFSFGGSSGSPVWAIPKVPPHGADPNTNKFRRLLLVGVNAGHKTADDGEHSGLSYFVKSSVLREILQQNNIVVP